MRPHGLLHLSLRIRIAIVLFFALWMSPAVVAQKVTSDYDKLTDFSGFKTYAWGEGMSVPNPNLDLYIKMVVDQDFETQGLKKVEANEADLIVAYQWASGTGVNLLGLVQAAIGLMQKIMGIKPHVAVGYRDAHTQRYSAGFRRSSR